MRKLVVVTATVVAALGVTSHALAATGTPFGGATVDNGVLKLVSNTGDASTTNDASGATFTGTGVTTFSSITHLSTGFNVTDDDCKGGSPRFQVGVQTASGVKNVFVYLGPSPSFTGCALNTWLQSGNLIGSTDVRFDTSQIVSGTQQSTYAQALHNVGSLAVTSISIVVDSGWAFDDKEQTVLVRNVRVNAHMFFKPHHEDDDGDEDENEGHPKGLNPAQACKKLRVGLGDKAFLTKYGTNENGANAFGKCVSRMARLRSDAAREAEVEEVSADARTCLKAAGHSNGKGKAKGNKGKWRSKASLRSCLRHSD